MRTLLALLPALACAAVMIVCMRMMSSGRASTEHPPPDASNDGAQVQEAVESSRQAAPTEQEASRV